MPLTLATRKRQSQGGGESGAKNFRPLFCIFCCEKQTQSGIADDGNACAAGDDASTATVKRCRNTMQILEDVCRRLNFDDDERESLLTAILRSYAGGKGSGEGGGMLPQVCHKCTVVLEKLVESKKKCDNLEDRVLMMQQELVKLQKDVADEMKLLMDSRNEFTQEVKSIAQLVTWTNGVLLLDKLQEKSSVDAFRKRILLASSDIGIQEQELNVGMIEGPTRSTTENATPVSTRKRVSGAPSRRNGNGDGLLQRQLDFTDDNGISPVNSASVSNDDNGNGARQDDGAPLLTSETPKRRNKTMNRANVTETSPPSTNVRRSTRLARPPIQMETQENDFPSSANNDDRCAETDINSQNQDSGSTVAVPEDGHGSVMEESDTVMDISEYLQLSIKQEVSSELIVMEEEVTDLSLDEQLPLASPLPSGLDHAEAIPTSSNRSQSKSAASPQRILPLRKRRNNLQSPSSITHRISSSKRSQFRPAASPKRSLRKSGDNSHQSLSSVTQLEKAVRFNSTLATRILRLQGNNISNKPPLTKYFILKAVRDRLRKERKELVSIPGNGSGDTNTVSISASELGYGLEYDLITETLSVGGVNIILNEDQQSVTCTGCEYTIYCSEIAAELSSSQGNIDCLDKSVLRKAEKTISTHIQTVHFCILRCRTCFREFSTKYSLLQHMVEVHKEPIPNARSEDADRGNSTLWPESSLIDTLVLSHSFECHMCPRIYTTQPRLDNHIKKRHSEKQEKKKGQVHVCLYCMKRFRKFEDVLHHLTNKHPEKTVFKCSFCQLLAKRKNNCTKHEKVCPKNPSRQAVLSPRGKEWLTQRKSLNSSPRV